MSSRPLSLTSGWFIAPGKEAETVAALRQLAAEVEAHEPDTLMYLVHIPSYGDDPAIQSLPPMTPNSVLFFEEYRTPQAFLNHVNGPVFRNFVTEHGSLFVNSDGKPFTTAQFLNRVAGFIRPGTSAQATSAVGNQHPAVMFEVIANDQALAKKFYSSVFGWQYETGTGGFAYVHFPERNPPLLGGIGQADPSIPGFGPGHTSYILVDDLEAAIQRALAAGGESYVPPTSVDGYNFAMVKDPEGNPVGLILPFASRI